MAQQANFVQESVDRVRDSVASIESDFEKMQKRVRKRIQTRSKAIEKQRKSFEKQTQKRVKKLRTEMYITHKAFVLFEEEHPVGWALVVWSNKGKEYDLQLYVKRACRRRGFGNRLFRRATRWVRSQGEKYVYFSDPENHNFFDQVKN